MDADIAVIGLGATGSMALWKLASKKGISVIGFEQYGIGHDRSAYGGGSRRFRIASPLIEETPFIRDSYFEFLKLEEETGQKVLSNSGSLTIGSYNSERMRTVMESALKYDVPHKILEKDELEKRFPQHKLFSDDIAVWDRLGGILRPEQTVIAAVNRARDLGANVLTYNKVIKVFPDNDGVTLITKDKEYRVKKIIVSNGAWAGQLMPSLKEVITAKRLVLTWFIPKNPDLFKEEKFPNFSRLSEGIHIQGTPATDGRMVRVTNGSDNIIESKININNPDDFSKDVSVEYAMQIRESISKLIPDLYPDPVQTLPFMDGFSKDGLPLIGNTKENKNVIFLCGFSGQGFSQAPTMGKIASEIALDDKTDYDIKHLSPGRFV